MKSGQIAHLDQNSANNIEENLAFLCLVHHDEYDSSTRQRKGLTESEVNAFRDELYERLGEYLRMPVHFGELELPPADPYAGAWIRIGDVNSSAEIILTPIGDGLEGVPRYAATGFALWGTDREFGPNLGEFAFVESVYDDTLEHRETHNDPESYSIIFRFIGQNLIVEEENWLGQYGMNVRFSGEYRRGQ